LKASTLKRITIALLGLAFLVGCSSDNDAADNNPEQDEATGDAQQASAEPINATWPEEDELVAEDVFPTLKSEEQKVRVGIESIVVNDDTMELRMVFSPEENVDELRFVDITKNMYSEVDVNLFDRDNLKRYSVLEEIDGAKRYQSPSDTKARAGETVGFQIFYPAPEDDIDVIDVELGTSLPIFEDVPLAFED